MGTTFWPLFDLVVETPRLTLRYVDDELAVELVELAVRGIHDPATMPFSIPWTDLPSARFEREALQFYWGRRAGVPGRTGSPDARSGSGWPPSTTRD